MVREGIDVGAAGGDVVGDAVAGAGVVTGIGVVAGPAEHAATPTATTARAANTGSARRCDLARAVLMAS